MALLAKNVNGGTTYEGYTITLGADIDLGAHNWTPIGNSSNQFKGTFEGAGYTISNLTITSTSNYRGLFGVNSGTIQNVTLTGVNVSGDWWTGGLVGRNYGTVQNVTLTGVNVSGGRYVGGLVGQNYYGTVTNCTVSGDSTVTGSQGVGGLVGFNEGNITVSGNTVVSEVSGGQGVGGLVGENEGYITVSGNTVVSEVSGGQDVGGLVGYNLGGTFSGNKFYSNAGDVGENEYGTVENNTQLYKLTLPSGVSATGDACVTVNGTTYATGTITLAAKTGYIYGGTTSAEITADTDLSTFGNATFDTANHYVFGNATDGYTLATADNTTDYPDLTQVYELTVPDNLKVTGDTVIKIDGVTYAAGNITLSAAAGYSLQNIKVNGETLGGNTFTVNAATTILADSIKFNKAGTGAEVGGTTGDLSANSGVYSVTASQQNSTLTGNNNNNTVVLEGGGENILTGGSGNDTYKFESGGGIVTDFGIGATKDSNGKALEAPLGSDIIKLGGTVSGVYFDRDASSKKSATFTAIVTYDSTADNDTQIVVLQNISKKPTKYGSNPVYQTNDAAAATLKIWDTSGTKQAILSASKLKALFRDDSELDELIQAKVTYLGDIADGKTPTTNPFEQTTTITPNGGDNG